MRKNYERFILHTDDEGNESIYDRCTDNNEPLNMLCVVSFMNEMDEHYFNHSKFEEISLVLGVVIGVVISYVVWCL